MGKQEKQMNHHHNLTSHSNAAKHSSTWGKTTSLANLFNFFLKIFEQHFEKLCFQGEFLVQLMQWPS